MQRFLQTALAYSSSNEPSDSEKMWLIIIFIVVLGSSLVSIAVSRARKARMDEVYGNKKEETSELKNVRVIEKSAEADSLLKTTVRRIVFEKQDGERIVLTVESDDAYQTISRGDTGTAYYRGKVLERFCYDVKSKE